MRPRLRSFELAWTDAAFDGIYPEPRHTPTTPGEKLASAAEEPADTPHGVARMHPARFFESLLFEAPLEQSLGLRLALWLVALSPIFTLHKLRTIAQLGCDDRVRVLDALLASPIYVVRQLVLSLKAMATLLYARSPHMRAGLRSSASRLVSLRTKKSPMRPGGSHAPAAE